MAEAEAWSEPVPDASTVEWKLALRMAILMAIPAGILSSSYSPVSGLGLIWMAMAALWTVRLYARSYRPAWMTLGAGARIGLVTGLLAAWIAVTVSGGSLFVQRYAMHQGTAIDAEWNSRVAQGQQMAEQIGAGMAQNDANQAQLARTQFQGWMLSPEGHAGMELFRFLTNGLFLIIFAILGGLLGARMAGRSRLNRVV